MIRQRKELTFRHNTDLGRHGWLRLTPAYSVRVVEDILSEESEAGSVFDPFSGTGTTVLAAANRGIPAFSVDINPFLVWFGRLKTRAFSQRDLELTQKALQACLGALTSVPPAPAPPIHNIERWWSPNRLRLLCRLSSAIDSVAEGETVARDLLRVAFCRTMIGLSNAAFNHQSMSFKVSKGEALSSLDLGPAEDPLLVAAFRRDASFVLGSAAHNPRAPVHISQDDARTLASVDAGSFDRLVTSPPYPNRMSYVRELRPYMYWMGFLKEAREAGELDWQAIGGTWGVATSRLNDWEPPANAFPKPLVRAIADIERCHAQNARLLARYVARYFQDMTEHIEAVAQRISRTGRVHYVVGNSAFYGVLVSVEQLFAELLSAHGFRDVGVRLLRKRNSKKELFEFDVVGRKA